MIGKTNAPYISGIIPTFSYDGNWSLYDDNNGNRDLSKEDYIKYFKEHPKANWSLFLKSSGNLSFPKTFRWDKKIDIFLCAGGGGGAIRSKNQASGGPGGGTYVDETGNLKISQGTTYPIKIGAGNNHSDTEQVTYGKDTTAFSKIASGATGKQSADTKAEATGPYPFTKHPNWYKPYGSAGYGGLMGYDDWGNHSWFYYGKQGGDGGGYGAGINSDIGSEKHGAPNRGCGGRAVGGNGSSGIVIIRNHRE